MMSARLFQSATTLALMASLAACSSADRPQVAADIRAIVPDDQIWYDAKSPKLAALKIEPVGTRAERVVGIFPSQVVFNENTTSRVLSPVTGRVTSVLAQPGQVVQRGTPLARLVSADAVTAATDLMKTVVVLRQAEVSQRRSKDLFQNRVIAQREMEQADVDVATARADYERARARASQLGGPGTASEFDLRAPVKGEVVERTAEIGMEVAASAGSPLFTISNLDSLWLTASVFQRDLPSAKTGGKLIFVSDGVPGRTFTAKVTYVSSQLDPQTRSATIRATVPNKDRALRASMFGEARLLAPDTTGWPVVPSSALVTTGNGPVVFVEIAPGKFRRQRVVIDVDDGESALIRDGIKAGDRVVVRGGLFLAAEMIKDR